MNKRQKMILEKLKACEIQDEKIKKLNELTENLIELTRKKLDLLKQVKIAYLVEYSQKNYVIIFENKVFESDNALTYYDYNYIFSDNEIKIFETKKFKLSQSGPEQNDTAGFDTVENKGGLNE